MDDPKKINGKKPPRNVLRFTLEALRSKIELVHESDKESPVAAGFGIAAKWATILIPIAYVLTNAIIEIAKALGGGK